jgi:hypothetical protein
MKPADIRAYVDRDWSSVRDLKERYWAERKRTLTPAEALGVGDQLRQYVLTIRPDWPDDGQRAADLRVHSRVSELLRRVRYPESI